MQTNKIFTLILLFFVTTSHVYCDESINDSFSIKDNILHNCIENINCSEQLHLDSILTNNPDQMPEIHLLNDEIYHAFTEVAVISLGNDNPHHHPNSEVLQRLVESGVYRIYQTGWGTSRGETPHAVRRRQAIFQGDVILTTDGQTYSISTNRSFDVDD